MPFHLMKGTNTLFYYGNIIYNVENTPNDYNNKIDLYLDCDCSFPKWKRVEIVFK